MPLLWDMRTAICICFERYGIYPRWWRGTRLRGILPQAITSRSVHHSCVAPAKFLILPGVLPLLQFLFRGIDKVKAKWAMICTAHNIAKLTA